MKHLCKYPCHIRKRVWAEAYAVVTCVEVLVIPGRPGFYKGDVLTVLIMTVLSGTVKHPVFLLSHISYRQTKQYQCIFIVVSCCQNVYDRSLATPDHQQTQLQFIINNVLNIFTPNANVSAQEAQFKHGHQDLVRLDDGSRILASNTRSLSKWSRSFLSICIPILKIRRSLNRRMFDTGIRTRARTRRYIKVMILGAISI